MIRGLKIRNYKSIRNLELELGRVNVIIGENGCGKTNILEAIVYASASTKNALNPEYLGRQLRLVAPEFMTPAFADIEEDNIENKTISITLQGEKQLPKAIKAIYDVFTGEGIDNICKKYEGKGYADFKADLADIVVNAIKKGGKK